VRRGSIVQLIVIGVLAGAVASAVALIPDWLPSSASREAGRIDFVFWFVTGICIFVFSIVAAVTVYSVWKFRVKPDDDSDGPPIHGHTGLEILWTAVPTLLVTANRNRQRDRPREGRRRRRKPVAGERLRAAVLLELRLSGLREQDLARAAPAGQPLRCPDHAREGRDPLVLGARIQAEAGSRARVHATLHITPNKVGTYPVICTELCGLGHGLMRSRVVVMQPDAFEKWAAQKGP